MGVTNLQPLILAVEREIEDRGYAHRQQGHLNGVPTGRRRWVKARPELLKMAEDAIAPSHSPESWADLQAMAMATPQPWRAYFHSMDGPALARFLSALKTSKAS